MTLGEEPPCLPSKGTPKGSRWRGRAECGQTHLGLAEPLRTRSLPLTTWAVVFSSGEWVTEDEHILGRMNDNIGDNR